MAAIVLAGGHSQRMGCDKNRLIYCEETLLTRVARIAGRAAPPVWIVADRIDRFADMSLPDYAGVIADRFPDSGPLGGLITGLEAAGEGVHFAAAGDMPNLNPAVIRLLLNRSEGFDGAIPFVGGKLHPLCAVYYYHCLERLTASLENGNHRLTFAVDTLNMLRVDEGTLRAVDPGLESLRNINTPADYESLLFGEQQSGAATAALGPGDELQESFRIGDSHVNAHASR